MYLSLHWFFKDWPASSIDSVLFLVMTEANFYKIHIILTPVMWCSVCKQRVKILPKNDEMTSTPCTKLSHFTTVFSALWSTPTLPPDACEHHLCALTYLWLFWKGFLKCYRKFKLRDFWDVEESLHNRLSAVPSGDTNHAFTLWPYCSSYATMLEWVCVMWKADFVYNWIIRTINQFMLFDRDFIQHIFIFLTVWW